MLSKTAEYALRAVACMASSYGRPLPADHLAERTQIPRRYLNRVLHELSEAGMVRSRPGPGGGYELCRLPEKITILDIINIVEPVLRIKKCPLGLKTHASLCPLHAELDRAYAAMEKAFANVTIQKLLKSTNAVTPLCENDMH